MSGNQRNYAAFIVLLYIVLAAAFVVCIYTMSLPHSPDEWKDFGIRIGVALTSVGTLTTTIVSLFTLNAQVKATADLEILKTNMARQSDFLKTALNARAIAHDKLFVGANNLYRELQKLAFGDFHPERIELIEQAMSEAQGLAANLDDEDRMITLNIVQHGFNIGDRATKLSETFHNEALRREYEKLWSNDSEVRELGTAIEQLQERSVFRNYTDKSSKE